MDETDPAAAPDDRPTITIRRIRQIPDNLRVYRLRIDGDVACTIRSGEKATVKVPPGRHEAWLSIDWFRSPKIALELAPGDEVTLEGGNQVRGWRAPFALLSMVVAPSRYLFLRRV
ncbi:MAG: hypothetical protein R3C15_06680 [Thermoleophilia bacterium]